jgi:ribonuclease HI
MLTIYTDGGNSLARQIGAAAAVVIQDDTVIAKLVEAFEGPNVTNNTMELYAVILACQYVMDHPELGKTIKIVSDSEYVVNGSKKWLSAWITKNWKTSSGYVKNKELWQAIAYLKTMLDIEWTWVRGHTGNIYNEMADKMAVNEYSKLIK